MLDKSVAVLDAVAARTDGATLADLVAGTGLSRATAHRLAVALEAHGLLRRDEDGRFALGLRLVGLGRASATAWPLAEAARPVLEELRAETGESVQLYVRQGAARICVDSLESPHELRTTVSVGARLPLGVGSAGRILAPVGAGSAPILRRRADDPDEAGWVASVEERAPGVASVSAAIRGASGTILAAVGISGPVDRTGRAPGERFGEAVVRAAREIERRAGADQ
ncbi:MAG: putative IclR family transcriptional regulator [Acidimicrobiales bacterium]|nr:putative IclR family transcriptional regulator [Acidimicrobiales bacterium]